MNIADLYRKIKQILNDSNTALQNKGLNSVSDLNKISAEISNLENVNKLTYLLGREIVELYEGDLVNTTAIRKYAFSDCTNLISVTIPDSVTTIGTWAFSGCSSLGNIYMYPTIPPTLADINTIPTTATIHVPVGSGEAYRNATNWSYYSSRIVEDIEVE